MKIMAIPPISYKKTRKSLGKLPFFSTRCTRAGTKLFHDNHFCSILPSSVFFQGFPRVAKSIKDLGLLRRDIKNEMGATRVVVML